MTDDDVHADCLERQQQLEEEIESLKNELDEANELLEKIRRML